MKVGSIAFAIAAWALATGHALAEPSAIIKMGDDHSITLVGTVTPTTASKIEEAIRAGTRTFIVENGGGDLSSALDLADVIRKFKVTVIATGYCLSACASYLLPASPHPTLRGVTIIGFHNTATSGLLAAQSQGGTAMPHEVIKLLQVEAHREQALYARVGIDPLLLITPVYELRPACVTQVRFEGKPDIVVGLSGASFWAPNGEVLSRYHYNLLGALPASPEQITATYGRILPASWPTFAGASKSFQQPSRSTIEAALKALNACSPEALSSPGSKAGLVEAEAVLRTARSKDFVTIPTPKPK